MAQDPRKRQQKLQKKAAKQKTRQQGLARLASRLMAPSLRKAGDWPLHGVLINRNWREPHTLTQIVVSRIAPNGDLALGNFLIDLGCLGVKNAFGKVVSESEYRTVVSTISQHQPLIPCDINLAAKIVRESITYARHFGFQPNRDTPQAVFVLGNADPDQCIVEIPLGGEDGKPFFFAGPYDDVDRIVAKLTKAVGADGFNYIVPLGDPNFFEDDDDYLRDTVEFDEDEDDE